MSNAITLGHNHNTLPWLILLICAALLSACVRTSPSDTMPWGVNSGSSTQIPASGESDNPSITARAMGALILSPTPDAPHPIPGMRTEPEQYVVQSGDTLGQIAEHYNISVEDIAAASGITDINILEVGQMLTIPVPEPVERGPGFKIIPNSELIAGPPTVYFDVPDFVYAQNGYLVRHEEEVDGRTLSGYQIVQRVAQDYSVNARLLLAVLEYQSGWVTDSDPHTSTLKYPLGWDDPRREGLYKQLAWAANELNRGYYLWRVDGAGSWVLPDGAVVPANATINAGTAGVQQLFSKLYGQEIWERTVSEDGFFAIYYKLFGYPFDYTYEPVLPSGLKQPLMQLPFESGVDWAFTGGPHGGWGGGSAWAALDFAPYVELLGCASSDDWIVAVADGVIVRAADSVVVQDLDNDGVEQTGWTVLYLHVETRHRVQVGASLQAGERIGHPSCEGGVSSGTHVHIARRYNGEWIPADQDIPFVLDGWVSASTGAVYEGVLQKGDRSIVADDGVTPDNVVRR
ncbi:MAG: LysM peptidoglycan-binding domain-containing protein [Chloroflexota bacterium]|nr:LysM peptidoglycan-binding domain-containing protein [Chloroflexota bacterium]